MLVCFFKEKKTVKQESEVDKQEIYLDLTFI